MNDAEACDLWFAWIVFDKNVHSIAPPPECKVTLHCDMQSLCQTVKESSVFDDGYIVSHVPPGGWCSVIDIALLYVCWSCRNPLHVTSRPYHCGGLVPITNAAEILDRLLKESPLCIISFPHGDAVAALREFLLYWSRLHLMVYLSKTMSQMMSSGLVGYSDCSLLSNHKCCRLHHIS